MECSRIVVYGGYVVRHGIEYCILEVSCSGLRICTIPYSTGFRKKRYSPFVDRVVYRVRVSREDVGECVDLDYNSIKDVRLMKTRGRDEVLLEIKWRAGTIIIHYPVSRIDYLRESLKVVKKHMGLD